MTDVLGELIGRLEKATGPDRELDVAIYRKEFPFPCVELSQRAQDEIDNFKAPHYTSSIDAAMTPVPPKLFSWAMGDCNENDQPWACLTDSDGTDYAATGATPIIALCIAVLKAIASLKARA